MATRTPARRGYGLRLARAMNSTNPPVTVRGLAKQMRPDGAESMRRLLRRFLKGERTPGPQLRGEIIAALAERKIDTSELEPDDEEEDAAMARDLLDLAALAQRISDRYGLDLLEPREWK